MIFSEKIQLPTMVSTKFKFPVTQRPLSSVNLKTVWAGQWSKNDPRETLTSTEIGASIKMGLRLSANQDAKDFAAEKIFVEKN